jgi:hypothetical protein
MHVESLIELTRATKHMDRDGVVMAGFEYLLDYDFS